jgi:hypothetical protein
VVPGYYDGPTGANRHTGGLLNTLSAYYSAGQFTNQDLWDVHLQYNMEVPVLRTMAWFLNIQVNNLLNSRSMAAYALPAQAARDTLGGTATRNPYGYKIGQNLTDLYTKDSAGNYVYRQSLRSISIQTGMRF